LSDGWSSWESSPVPPLMHSSQNKRMIDISRDWSVMGDGDAFCTVCNLFVGFAPPHQHCGYYGCERAGMWHEYVEVERNSLDHARFHRAICAPSSRSYFYSTPLLLDENEKPVLRCIYGKEGDKWEVFAAAM